MLSLRTSRALLAAFVAVGCSSNEVVFSFGGGTSTSGTGGMTSTTITAGSDGPGGSAGSGGSGGSGPGGSGGVAGGGTDDAGACSYPPAPSRDCTPGPIGPIDPVIPAFGLISDFDHDSGLGIETTVPAGVWAIDQDNTGTTDLRVEPCGTTGNGLHFKGAGHTSWGADVAAAFISQTQPINVAGKFGYLSFVMASAQGAAVTIKLQNTDSQPPLCECSQITDADCYGGYVTVLPSPTVATKFYLPWRSFRPSAQGYHRPGQTCINPAELISIAFAVDGGRDFDLCIDDVQFESLAPPR